MGSAIFTYRYSAGLGVARGENKAGNKGKCPTENGEDYEYIFGRYEVCLTCTFPLKGR